MSRWLINISLLGILLTISSACKKESSPSIPDCQKNNTGDLFFRSYLDGNQIRYIYFDGKYAGNVSGGHDAIFQKITAGPHSWYISAGQGQIASGTVEVLQCGNVQVKIDR